VVHLSFRGKVALVTGADDDRGRRCAGQLAERGARLAVGLAGDAGPPGDALAVVRAVEAFGRLDVLVHLPEPPGAFGAAVDGLASTFRVLGPAWQRMRRQGHGRVVLVADVGHAAAGVEGAALAMGLVGLARVLGIEGRGHHVSVNVVLDLGDRSTVLAALPPDHPAPPDRACLPPRGDGRRGEWGLDAAAVAYLANEACPFNGAVVAVRGDWLAHLAMGVGPGVFDPGLTVEAIRRLAGAVVADDHLITPEDAGGEMPLLTARLTPALDGRR
jgi:NAD(P)-dependent dehydrogenase (short-subunit alcohol dehydrogenase family)